MPSSGWATEFVERHPVEVVAVAAQPADQPAAAGAVGGVAALERLPAAFDPRVPGCRRRPGRRRAPPRASPTATTRTARAHPPGGRWESVDRLSTAAPSATASPTASAAGTSRWWRCARSRASPCRLRRSPTCSTAGAAAAIPAATGTSTANVRVRPGSSANTSTSITGVAYSEPRLWLSSATSASSTAPPASTPAQAPWQALAARQQHAPARRPSATARRWRWRSRSDRPGARRGASPQAGGGGAVDVQRGERRERDQRERPRAQQQRCAYAALAPAGEQGEHQQVQQRPVGPFPGVPGHGGPQDRQEAERGVRGQRADARSCTGSGTSAARSRTRPGRSRAARARPARRAPSG